MRKELKWTLLSFNIKNYAFLLYYLDECGVVEVFRH
jgi:hypothetical protein